MSDYGTIIEEGTAVRFERLLPAPPDKVWSYLTEPARMRTWFMSGAFEHSIGGRVELRGSESDVTGGGDNVIRGVVTQWDPPRALAYTWVEWSSSKPKTEIADSIVRFELADRGDSTLLTLTHRRITPNSLRGFAPGWHAFLDVLAQRMRGEQTGDFGASFKRLQAEYAPRFE